VEAPEPVSTWQEPVSPFDPLLESTGTTEPYKITPPVWSNPIEMIAAKSIFDNLAVESRPWNLVTQEEVSALLSTLGTSSALDTPFLRSITPRIAPFLIDDADSQATTYESNAEQDHD
jgi:hypothetical protein